MRRTGSLVFGALCAVLLAQEALAQDIGGKLPAEYGSASAAEKMVMIATAIADEKIKTHKERQAAQAAVDAIFVAELSKEETSKAKLLRMGALREQTKAACDALNKARREARQRSVSFMEPDSNLQCSVAQSFVADAAGGSPSLEALRCLSVVRANTSWMGHGTLTHALVSEALYRDEAFLAADAMGKLAVIKRITEDDGMLSSQEQKYLDKAILVDWMSSKLAAGETPAQVLTRVQDLGLRRLICFFTKSWAQSVLEELARVR